MGREIDVGLNWRSHQIIARSGSRLLLLGWLTILFRRLLNPGPYRNEQVPTSNHRYVARRLADLGCCRLVQDGQTEKTFLFAVHDFPEVAAIVLPRRRRQISDAERQRLADLSKRHGFKPHQSVERGDAPTHADEKSDLSVVPAI